MAKKHKRGVGRPLKPLDTSTRYGRIGASIRRMRLEHGLTQAQLGEKLNLCQDTISAWERGIGLEWVADCQDLCRVMRCRLDELG